MQLASEPGLTGHPSGVLRDKGSSDSDWRIGQRTSMWHPSISLTETLRRDLNVGHLSTFLYLLSSGAGEE